MGLNTKTRQQKMLQRPDLLKTPNLGLAFRIEPKKFFLVQRFLGFRDLWFSVGRGICGHFEILNSDSERIGTVERFPSTIQFFNCSPDVLVDVTTSNHRLHIKSTFYLRSRMTGLHQELDQLWKKQYSNSLLANLSVT